VTRKGFFILFGSPGAGKSFEAAHAFQQSLYIRSSNNILQFYEQWLKSETGQASGLGVPAVTLTLDDYFVDVVGADQYWDTARQLPPLQADAAGNLVKVQQLATLQATLQAVIQECHKNRANGLPPSYNGVPIRNVIIDEGSKFWMRIFSEIKPTCVAGSGNVDNFAAFNTTADWSEAFLGQLRTLPIVGVNLVFIAHDQDPDPGSGRKGGPKCVSQSIMKTMCADADGVLLRVLERPPLAAGVNAKPLRRWRVHAHPDWITKLRGVSDEQFEEMATMSLVDIVRYAGFEP
jgi:hypothetical protein